MNDKEEDKTETETEATRNNDDIRAGRRSASWMQVERMQITGEGPAAIPLRWVARWTLVVVPSYQY